MSEEFEMVSRIFFCLIFVCGLFFYAALNPGSATGDTDQAVYVQACMKEAKSKNFQPLLKQMLALNGWPPEAVELNFKYQSEVILDPLVLRRLCTEGGKKALSNAALFRKISEEQEANNGLSPTAIKLLYQIVVELFARGLSRIPSNELGPYFAFSEALFSQMPSYMCRAIWRQSPSIDINNFMQRMQGLLPLEIQKNYLQLVKQAVFAEVKNWPRIVQMGQLESAQEAVEVEKAFGDHLTVHSSLFSNPVKLALILNNLKDGTDEEYCDVGRLYFGAMRSMPGRDGNRTRKLYIMSLFAG